MKKRFIAYLYSLACSVTFLCLALPLPATAGGNDNGTPVPAGPSVLFISPGSSEDLFFSRFESFMQAAADDLGISLEILHTDRNFVTTHQVASEVIKRKSLQEYLILINENDLGRLLLPPLAQRGMKIILINEGLHPKEREIFGNPGEKYPTWFAEFLPDDTRAGEIVAENLISTRLSQGDRAIFISALSGTVKTTSSDLRTKGLVRATARHAHVKINQVVPAFYERDKAKKVTSGLLSRYPGTDIIWAASDSMALGAVDAINNTGRTPGKDILIGGIDWTDQALDAIMKGRINASAGGHFMDGGWALVMIYDHSHGYRGPFPQKSSFAIIDRTNIKELYPYLCKNNWQKINFRHFSRILSQCSQYHFTLEAVLKELRDN